MPTHMSKHTHSHMGTHPVLHLLMSTHFHFPLKVLPPSLRFEVQYLHPVHV